MDRFKLSKEEMEFLRYIINPKTSHKFDSPSQTIKYWFLDCEMVETVNGVEVVSIGFGTKDNNSLQMYNLMIRPKGRVTDYITKITGFNEETKFDMELEEAIEFLKNKIGADDVLIGHHMYTDLKLLNIYHPNIIDCAMIFHHPDGPPHFYSLKNLARMYLKKEIQVGVHDPLEDGKTCLELVEWCEGLGYLKNHWKKVGEKFVPSIRIISESLDLTEYNKDCLKCIYTRGSRAIGTNRPDSDYDVVVIVDKLKIINGTLTRYGNIDVVIYDIEYFQKLLRDQVVWALECIYCPPDLIYLEKINFREYQENYRISNKLRANNELQKSVGYETARKMSSAKKHFYNGDIYHSIKHIFIAIRFVDYGRQMVKHDKITDIRAMKWFWDVLKSSINELKEENESLYEVWDDFKKEVWRKQYIDIYREFSNYAPKKAKKKNLNREIYGNLLKNKNCNFDDETNIPSIEEFDSMTMLERLDLLKEELEDPFSFQSKYLINVHSSLKYPYLILLRYNNKTPNSIFKRMCRGIIYDMFYKRIVAYPFDNFVQDLKLKPKYILNKLDGSFCMLYYYKGVWNISTSRNPDGDSIIGSRSKKEIVFSELFWRIFDDKGYKRDQLNPNYNYMFEMLSIDHTIILQYETDDIILIGVRDMENGFVEKDIFSPEFSTFDKPRIYSSIQEMNREDPDTIEGCVIVDDSFNRQKIKLPQYVKKAYMFPLCTKNKSMDMKKHVLRVLLEGELDEFIKYCPEFKEIVDEMRKSYSDFIQKINSMYDEIMKYQVDSRKEYAEYVKKYNWSYQKYLYARYDRINMDIFISSLSIKRIYHDLFLMDPSNNIRITLDYGYSRDNQLGKYKDLIEEWKNYQIECSSKIIFEDEIKFNDVRYVGGLDISFDKVDDNRGVAYLSVYDIVDNKMVYESHKISKLTVPYISGLLGFREVSEYMDLLNELKKDPTNNKYYPHVLMVDGLGILHHRNFGSASHIGYEMDIPSIGMAKTMILYDGLIEREIKANFRQKCKNKGDYIELKGKSKKVWGVAYKSSKSINPIYITIGHKLSLNTCIKIVEKCCIKYRIPEPVRNSDIKSKHYL